MDVRLEFIEYHGHGLKKRFTQKDYEQVFNIPIVPYDAIILLARIINTKTRNALENLQETVDANEQDFFDCYFKIYFLNHFTFDQYQNQHRFFKYIIAEFKSIFSKKENGYAFEKSFLNVMVNNITKDHLEKGTPELPKETLIRMYDSALHMVFLYGYSIKEDYHLKNDMTIVEICSMFLKLIHGLKHELLPVNSNAANEIAQYQTNVNNIQTLFSILYAIPYEANIGKLDLTYTIRLYYKGNHHTLQKYSSSDVYLLFQTDIDIIKNLNNKQVSIERLDKNDLEIIYFILLDHWQEVKNANKSLPDLPSFKTLTNKPMALSSEVSTEDKAGAIVVFQNDSIEKFSTAIKLAQPSPKPSLYSRMKNMFTSKHPAPSAQPISTGQAELSEKKTVNGQGWGSYIWSLLNPLAWYDWYYEGWD